MRLVVKGASTYREGSAIQPFAAQGLQRPVHFARPTVRVLSLVT